MSNILLIGNGAREHAIAEAIMRSPQNPRLFSFMKSNNPGIASLSEKIKIGSYSDLDAITGFAKENKIDFAVIGPEDPLNNGVVDALAKADVPSVGPTKSLARLETSKSFTRNLVNKYKISGNPKYKVFLAMDGVEKFLNELEGIVLKPDGLTGGKGVMVQGDHFSTKKEALKLCEQILGGGSSVIVEEKFDGEEFSLQCLCDGKTVVGTPLVQDHKRRFDGDKGPNTGGMGSYSLPDHSMLFLKSSDIEAGLEITRQVAAALSKETGSPYKGIMYGGFIATKNGVKLLEYNARFGDPEAMNILPLLKTDFVEICWHVIDGTLDKIKIEFEHKATVCKYVVPKGYGLPADHPDAASSKAKIEVGNVGKARLYYSSVDKKDDGLYLSSSRAIGIVGIADTLEEARNITAEGVKAVKGPVAYREDIGTDTLIQKRIDHMQKIRKG
ncbi:MAG TPA: phosphoribosylamine--glycine ligase [Smithellaceae bacterium]|jgi:phosphoribosylamine--glycine ligase|nr:phosphoribosylamine--glycine ligase [Smithellaceae bacterium]HNV64675.1 phosphoribosylamine--glycine ligase [Smithellaceae bacterium]HOD31805.1 phosphoribosylamine--glycine ligase [Smithellaceae bacterium]HOF78094.1 phosphoribosylamine--glycine ligase [Smithellaceae bacterium]HOM68796.1 phosphoribosylamine--glycine ligase [Smithellaceae bacterium]